MPQYVIERAPVTALNEIGPQIQWIFPDEDLIRTGPAGHGGAYPSAGPLTAPTPLATILFSPWGCSAVGSAREWHSRGHGFDPRQLHQLLQQLPRALKSA
jgi:hypothetical protein